jgi:hypothetical protein
MKLNTKELSKCRGRKLVGVRKTSHVQFSDQYVACLILEFDNGATFTIEPVCSMYSSDLEIIKEEK